MSRETGKDRTRGSREAAPGGATPSLEPSPIPPSIDREGAAVALRLAIGKDGLGIELARPATLGCLDVVELVVRLPQVRFPFDVTGGVAKFRHRRGELERYAIELDARRVARWAEPRLRGLVAAGTCRVTIAFRAFGATVSIVAAEAAQNRALCFEVALSHAADDLVLVVHTARGVHLAAPATLLAMRALARLTTDIARREGVKFIVPHSADRLARALLPDAGVRAASGAGVVLTGSGENDGVLFVACSKPGPSAGRSKGQPEASPPAVALALETALLTRAADDARFAGDLERARHLDLTALERAPGHPQIARRIAEIDAHVGGRAEAAVSTLRAADRAVYLGALLGELLVEIGDPSGGIAALLREGEREPSSAVAALVLARAAELASDPVDALRWLDIAVGRAPTLAELRWERATRRLVQGRLADARADFQELEALATGPRARYEALKRAADVHRAHGLGNDAAGLYERALLYRPDEPDAIAGLGASLAAEGRLARGVTLLAQAISLAEAVVPPRPTAWMELELGVVLGDKLGERPAAIARLRGIPDDASEAIPARGLEGRYRAALGDAAGASLAFARLRERAGNERRALPWLDEAALFEEQRGELALAQAHLGVAIAIAPDDTTRAARYRALGERLGRAARAASSRRSGIEPALLERLDEHRPVTIGVLPDAVATPHASAEATPALRERVTVAAPPEGAQARAAETLAAPPSSETAPTAPRVAVPGPTFGPNLPTAPAPPVILHGVILPIPTPGVPTLVSELEGRISEAPPSAEEDEMRVEALTRTLQGDPTNDAVVDELTVRLTRLGRSMDLLALLSARIEDAPPERRAELLPRHRAVLEQLEREARAAGRDGEADLFKMARDAS